MFDFSAIPFSTWIALAAATAAIASAIFGLRNFLTARRALAIAMRTALLANPETSVYLVDAFRYRPKDSDVTLYVFSISIESQSTLQNSVVNIELRIPFVKGGIERIAVFGNTGKLAQSAPLSIRNVFQLPALLPARGALAANCCFEVHQDLLQDADYGPLGIRVKFAAGPVRDIMHNVIMDIVNVEHLEKKRETGVPV